ncbi:unnamed protein product [Prunus armeniaca]
MGKEGSREEIEGRGGEGRGGGKVSGFCAGRGQWSAGEETGLGLVDGMGQCGTSNPSQAGKVSYFNFKRVNMEMRKALDTPPCCTRSIIGP